MVLKGMIKFLRNIIAIICMSSCGYGLSQEIKCNKIYFVIQRSDSGFLYPTFGSFLSHGLNRDSFLAEDPNKGQNKVEFSELIYKYYTNKPTKLERNDGCYSYIIHNGYKNYYENYLIKEDWDKFDIGMTLAYGARVLVVRKGFDLSDHSGAGISLKIGLPGKMSSDYSDKLLAAFNQQMGAAISTYEKRGVTSLVESLAEGEFDILVLPYGDLESYRSASPSKRDIYSQVEEFAYLGDERIPSNTSLPTLQELGIDYGEAIPLSVAFPLNTDEAHKAFILDNIEHHLKNNKELYDKVLAHEGFRLFE